jgi:hypothetical protein
MNLPQLVQAFYDTTSVNDADEQEALNIIFECSDFILHRQDFAKQHILPEDAEVIALSNKYFISDNVENGNLSMELVTTAFAVHPEYLAHHLAFTEPTLATQLLEELLYYRTKGRI